MRTEPGDGGALPRHMSRLRRARHGNILPAGCRSRRRRMVVAFSCKARGICNSCDGRRMTEVAAHWVDEVWD